MDTTDAMDTTDRNGSVAAVTGVAAPEQLDFVGALGDLDGPVPTWQRSRRITEALAALYKRRSERGACVVLSELPDSTGREERRIDLFVMFLWNMDRLRRIAYEVKVTRADFLSELRKPEKRAFALSVSNEYYFVTPPGLVRPSEIPPEAGLIEVTSSGVRVKRTAPFRETGQPPWYFVAALVRAATRLTPIP